MMRAIVKLSCIGKIPEICIPIRSGSRQSSTVTKNNSRTQNKKILFQNVNDCGVVVLNRPEALNAFDMSMTLELASTLKDWESKKRLVMIKGVDDNLFSAGGDVKSVISALKDSALENMKGESSQLFRHIFRIVHHVGTYKKPFIAIMSGPTIGGSGALCSHGKYRIATEKTLYAIPECSIGLFPDAGNTYFLPRLKNKLGYFLGMTAYRLKGADTLFAGIATHYVPTNKLQSVTEELLSENSNIDAVLEPYLPENTREKFSLAPYVDLISQCFAEPTVEKIIKRLQEDKSEFAKNTIELMGKLSPTSLKVTKKAFDQSSNMTLAECLRIEFRLLCRCLDKNGDFPEGVRAKLIDKDQNPKWNPKSLEEVSDDYINQRFSPLPPEFELII